MKTIVVAVDFSDSTKGVLEAAKAQATAFGAALHVVHVLEPEPAYTAYGFTPDEFPAMHVFQEEARKRAQEVLARGVPADTDAYLAMEAALRRSNLRLEAVRRYRRGTRMPTSES